MIDNKTDQAFNYFNAGQYALAEKTVRSILDADPDDASAHCLLARCLAQRGALEEALNTIQLVLATVPDADWVFNNAAHIYMKVDLDHARKMIDTAIKLAPDNVGNWEGLVRIHLAHGHWQEALSSCERALSLDPADRFCLNIRAVCLFHLGQHDKSEQALQIARIKDPTNTISFACEGWMHLKKENFQKAHDCFTESLRLDPEYPWARMGLLETAKRSHWIYSLHKRCFHWTTVLGLIVASIVCIITSTTLGEFWPPIIWLAAAPLCLYLVLVVLSYVIDLLNEMDWGGHLSSFVLSLDPHWKMALTDDETKICRRSLLTGVVYVGVVLFCMWNNLHVRFSHLMGACILLNILNIAILRREHRSTDDMIDRIYSSLAWITMLTPLLICGLAFDFLSEQATLITLLVLGCSLPVLLTPPGRKLLSVPLTALTFKLIGIKVVK